MNRIPSTSMMHVALPTHSSFPPKGVGVGSTFGEFKTGVLERVPSSRDPTNVGCLLGDRLKV